MIERKIKKLSITVLLVLFGCNGNMPLILPDRQDINFACDLDPNKQGCERLKDYQEHYRLIKKAAINIRNTSTARLALSGNQPPAQ